MLSIHFVSVVQDCLRHFKVQSHMTDAACSVCILCRICQLSRMVELHAVDMPESFFGVFFKTKSQCLVMSRNLHGDKQKPSTKRKYLEDIDDSDTGDNIPPPKKPLHQNKGSCFRSDSPVFHISIP